MQKFVSFYILLLAMTYAVTDVYPDPTPGSTPIQDAIDDATPGETIIVHDGTYTENLLIEKDLILRSENGAGVTTIDGSDATNGSDMGSAIIVRPESNTTHHPLVVIDGFTVTGGKGSICKYEIETPNGPQVVNEKVGGGMYAYVSSPKLINSNILGNGGPHTRKGGAIFAASDTEDCDWSTRDDYIDHEDLAPIQGELDFSNNIFLDNESTLGKTIYIIGNIITDISDGYFDVYDYDLEGSSEYWIRGVDTEFDESNGNGVVDAIEDNVYVAPWGNDSLNTGLSTSSPFKTINYAISRVYADSLNPATIHLDNGIYSTSKNGEIFPLLLINWITILGSEFSTTILDAENNSRVVECVNVDGSSMHNLIIENGTANEGGGIYAEWCNAEFNNLIIRNNYSNSSGGGADIRFSIAQIKNSTFDNNESNQGGALFIFDSGYDYTIDWHNYYLPENIVIVDNVIFENNQSNYSGTIFVNNKHFPGDILKNITVRNNYAAFGAGIHIWDSNTQILHSLIHNNTTYNDGGGILASGTPGPIIINSTITNNIHENYDECIESYENIGWPTWWCGGGGGITMDAGRLIILNSIIWGNYPDQVRMDGNSWGLDSKLIVSHSDIMGGMNGVYESSNEYFDLIWLSNNINENPYFVDSNTANYNLLSNDDITSPCIDAGTMSFSYTYENMSSSDGSSFTRTNYVPWSDFNGQAPDMGAFEYYYSPTTGCTDPIACNYNSEANVDDGNCEYEIDCAGVCGGELELDCGGVCGGDNSTADNCCGLPFNDDCSSDCYENPETGECCPIWEVDECGICDGIGSSCSCGTGDMNQDNTLNVLDIVYLVELILASDTPNEDEICQGDIGIDGGEGDGMLNVMDIVAIVNIVLNV